MLDLTQKPSDSMSNDVTRDAVGTASMETVLHNNASFHSTLKVLLLV